MNGTWYVGYVGPLDEPDAGRGSCQITPNLVFTIDSSANGVVVLDTIGISSQLACMSGNQYQLDIRSSLAVVTDSSGDKHGVAFKVNGPSPDELLIFVFPDIGGDSIGGKVIDVDTLSGTLIGQSVWSANRL
jgi:hypothetical protein